MNPNKFFYTVKPLIPRDLQLSIRRFIALIKKKRHTDIWPIDPNAGKKPENFSGWPDGKKFALILQHDVDTQKGHDNCYKLMEAEKALNVRSLFSFVPERYKVSPKLRKDLIDQGFSVAVHGLKHDGKLFSSEEHFRESAIRINNYLKEWDAYGFTSPSMHHNLDWMHYLNINFSTSTFDTDPFEPDPDGVGTIFPFFVQKEKKHKGFVELPYTLPQDHLLYIILMEKNIDIWKKKLDWIAEQGGMVLVNTHPDYMNFGNSENKREEYPVGFYIEFLEYIINKYRGQYWHALPGDVSEFWRGKKVI
jgi:hypothetical protein